MIDFSHFINDIKNTPLRAWAEILPEQIAAGLSHKRYGDLKQWLEAMQNMPALQASSTNFKDKVEIGEKSNCSEQQWQALEANMKALHPWRKGPYDLFGLHVDTEWRSDWKWDRLLPHIAPLKNRTVLDVGCGNGYHCWRMWGEGAQRVIGIDPSPRFVVQFYALKQFVSEVAVDVLPVGIQDLPENTQAFDTTFSMGVLYHRPSPMDHLKQLRNTLKSGGELVLETLIIEGALGECLVPEERYAKMNNVWFIPSAPTLVSWLKKCGFENVRCVDINQTSTDEQRVTEWMSYQSLSDFLDPSDPSRTVEGHPAPTRGIFVATRKN
ncbi:MAG: tRNA 5-methoxyuridine(34)/uridine 5-oxyacetic acid(34) synthase CmoB [Agarilytica sp.]